MLIFIGYLIPLTQGKDAIVDKEDYEYINQRKWYAHKERHRWYALRGGGGSELIRMHRVIMNASKGQFIDHINNNGLDNRKCNLRFCTNSQNLQNAQKRINCSSRYKGVCWHKNKKKWQANICINQKMRYIGRYDSEVEAALAYDKKAKELFGEFANPNFMTFMTGE